MFNLHNFLVALFIYVGDKLRNTHHPWPCGSIYSFLEVGRPPFLAFLFTTYLYDKASLRFTNIYDITNMYCKCGVNSKTTSSLSRYLKVFLVSIKNLKVGQIMRTYLKARKVRKYRESEEVKKRKYIKEN